jgi:hypothetical protein
LGDSFTDWWFGTIAGGRRFADWSSSIAWHGWKASRQKSLFCYRYDLIQINAAAKSLVSGQHKSLENPIGKNYL